MLEIPIWFPESHPTDSAVAGFWKAFPKDEVTEVTAETRAAFEHAVGLRVALGGQSLPVAQFSTLTTTSSRWGGVSREWQQEAGFCCLIFRFYFKDDSVLTQKPLTISYRQPLVQANGVSRFFYLPIFQNLPKGASTADTNRYSITLVAQPDCSLIVNSGGQECEVKAGHSITLSPRHHQAIRAVATRWPKSLQATRDGVSSSAVAEDAIRPACLDVRRQIANRTHPRSNGRCISKT